MSFRHNIYPELNLVYIQATGENTVDEFSRYALAIPNIDERYVVGMNTLLDCRNAEVPAKDPLEENKFHQFADKITSEEDGFVSKRRQAIVAPTAIAFGVTRMRTVALADSQIDYGVFRTMEEAQAWLDLSEDLQFEVNDPES